MKNLILSFGVLMSVITQSNYAKADSMVGPTMATPFLVQNYAGDSIVIFNVGSTCYSGKLDANLLSSNDKSRLVAMVSLAKSTGMQMMFYYNQNGSNCNITSFALAPN